MDELRASLTPVTETPTAGLPTRRFSKVVLAILYAAALVPLLVGSCGIVLVARDALRNTVRFGLLATTHNPQLMVAFGFFGDMLVLGASCFILPWCLQRKRTRTAFWVTVGLFASLTVVLLVSYLDGRL